MRVLALTIADGTARLSCTDVTNAQTTSEYMRDYSLYTNYEQTMYKLCINYD
jgi:hypothetical protein